MRVATRHPSALGLLSVRTLSLTLLPDRLAVCWLDPGSELPVPAGDHRALWSVTRTPEEISVVLPEEEVRPGWKVEPGWRVFRVAGPLAFGLTGVVASLTPARRRRRPGLHPLHLRHGLSPGQGGDAGADAGGSRRGRPRGSRMTFKDHFSGHAGTMPPTGRDTRPRAVRLRGASAPRQRTGLGLGTGSGQAALGLAERFERVIATDLQRAAARARRPPSPGGVPGRPRPRPPACRSASRGPGRRGPGLPLVRLRPLLRRGPAGARPGRRRRGLDLQPGAGEPGGGRAGPTAWRARSSARTGRPSAGGSTRSTGRSPSPSTEVEAPPFFHEGGWDLERFLLYIGTWSACQPLHPGDRGDPRAENRPEIEAAWGGPRAGADVSLAPLRCGPATGDRLDLDIHYPCLDDYRTGQPQGRGGQDDDGRQPGGRARRAGQAGPAGGPRPPGLGIPVPGGPRGRSFPPPRRTCCSTTCRRGRPSVRPRPRGSS